MVCNLEKEMLSLKNNLEEALLENETSRDIISELQKELATKQEKSEDQAKLAKELKDEVTSLGSELFNTKMELSNHYSVTKENIDKLENACKNLKGKNQTMKKTAEARVKYLENELELALCNTKNEKVKELETYLLNSIQDASAASNLPSTMSKYSQTLMNQDIPYRVTQPLPPIFGSQLCHFSKRINHISNSFPNLSTITWVTVTKEDQIRDEAE